MDEKEIYLFDISFLLLRIGLRARQGKKDSFNAWIKLKEEWEQRYFYVHLPKRVLSNITE